MSPSNNSSAPSPEKNNTPVAGKIVRIPAPVPGQALEVESSPNGQLQFSFDPSTVSTSRVGNSLVFEATGGGKTIVTDFFAVGDQTLPSLVLTDGTVVPSSDFFASSGMDMTTAAGPSTPSAAPGSGGTSYSDDAGELLGGLDRLGSLGTDGWTRETESFTQGAGYRRGIAAAAPETADIPVTPETPVSPVTPPVTPVTPVVPPVTPPPPSLSLAFTSERTVSEAGLHGGSGEGSGSFEAKGVFTFANAQGLVTMDIGGQQVNLAALSQGYSQTFTVAGGVGHLTLTGYDAASGKVTYVYSLEQAITHDPSIGEGDAALRDTFQIRVTDEAGRTADGPLRITVQDDTVQALDDVVSIKAGTLAGLSTVQPGHSLLLNDSTSADGQRITELSSQDSHVRSITEVTLSDGHGGTLSGWKVTTDYGVYTVRNDGAYTFSATDEGGVNLFNTLNGAAGIKLAYTLTDGDGDASSAGITLNMYHQAPGNTNLAPQIVTSGFAVNDIITATGDQAAGGVKGMYSKVTSLPDGTYVIAWQNNTSIYTQHYAATGEKIGSQTTVTTNAYAINYDHSDSFTLSGTPAGGYLVTWDSGNRTSGFGTVYDANGAVIKANISMAGNDYYNANSVTNYNWSQSSEYSDARETVALAKGGYFLAVNDNDGQYYGIKLVLLNANGTPATIRVTNIAGTVGGADVVFQPETTTGHSFNPRMVELGPDRVAIVFIHSPSSGYSQNTGMEGSVDDRQGAAGSKLDMVVYDVTRDAAGNITGVTTVKAVTEFSSMPGTNKMPELCTLDSGRFALVWQQEVGSGSRIELQVFDNTGTPMPGFTSPVAVGGPAGLQFVPTVTATGDGGFVVVWTQQESGTAKVYDILAQRYDAQGRPLGSAHTVAMGVDSYGTDGSEGTQRHPDATLLSDGRLVITWTTQADPTGKSEVHHQILSPDVLSGTEHPPVYVNGQEHFMPLAQAIVALYDPNAGDTPSSVRVAVSNAHNGDNLSIDADWCAAHGIAVQVGANGTALTFTVLNQSLSASAQWQLISDAVRHVEYKTTLPDDQLVGGIRTLEVTVVDNHGASNSVTANIEVVINNDPPVLDFTGSAHQNEVMGDAVALVAPGGRFTITDTEQDNIAKATVTVTNFKAGVDHLSLDLPAGDPRFVGITASFDQNTGVLTITGSTTASVYQQVLTYLYYQGTSNVPLLEDRLIEIRVSDESGLRSWSGPVTVSVTTEHPTAPLITMTPDVPAGNQHAGQGDIPVSVALEDGGFAVCMKSGSGMRVEFFNANGTERGDSFQLNGVDSVSAIRQLNDGSLLISGSHAGVGTLLHGDTLGNFQMYNTAITKITDIAAAPEGGSVVAGISGGQVVWQSISASGVPGTVHTVAAAPGTNANVEIAMQAHGAFAVIYEAANSASSVAVFNAQGVQLGATFILPQELVSSASEVAIAALDSGQYAVAYRSSYLPAGEAPFATETLRVSILNPDGSHATTFTVDQLAHTVHSEINVAALNDGKFAVSWHTAREGSNEVYVSVVDAHGSLYSSFAVQGTGLGTYDHPTVSALHDGGYVASWHDSATGTVEYHVFNSDGSARDTHFYVANNDPVAVFHDVHIADPNHDLIAKAVISIDGFKAGDVLSFDHFDPAGHGLSVAYNAANGTMTVTGSAGSAVYEQLLNALQYENHTDRGMEGVRTFGVVVTDNSSALHNVSNTLSGTIEVHEAYHTITGTDGSDNLTASLGNTVIHGGAGNDLLYGGTGHDTLFGDLGNDTLVAGSNGNHLHGGVGNDILVGGAGDDTFHWSFGDQNTSLSPAMDTVRNFSMNNLAGKGDDILDLRGLLSGATHETLDDYLITTKNGNNAELRINTSGHATTQGPDQIIVLENVYTAHSDGGHNSAVDINELIKQHILLNG